MNNVATDRERNGVRKGKKAAVKVTAPFVQPKKVNIAKRKGTVQFHINEALGTTLRKDNRTL